jgi:hypothetical protein
LSVRKISKPASSAAVKRSPLLSVSQPRSFVSRRLDRSSRLGHSCYLDAPDSIPKNVLGQAECVVILPSVLKRISCITFPAFSTRPCSLFCASAGMTSAKANTEQSLLYHYFLRSAVRPGRSTLIAGRQILRPPMIALQGIKIVRCKFTLSPD